MAAKKKPERKAVVDRFLNEVRCVIAYYASAVSEQQMLEALVAESEGWKKRLQELEEEVTHDR